jgi:hypothetical protein
MFSGKQREVCEKKDLRKQKLETIKMTKRIDV